MDFSLVETDRILSGAKVGELSALYKDLVWSRSIPKLSIIAPSMMLGPAFKKLRPCPLLLLCCKYTISHRWRQTALKCYKGNNMTGAVPPTCAHGACCSIVTGFKNNLRFYI